MRQRTTYLTTTAILATVVCVTTAYLLHIPFGANGAYIHLGDTFIYLAAALLPKPYAMTVGALGSAMADLLTAPIWAPGTMIIKAALVLPFPKAHGKMIQRKTYFSLLIAALITMASYAVYERILFGTWAGAVLSLVSSLVQSIASAALFITIGFTLDRIHFLQKTKKAS